MMENRAQMLCLVMSSESLEDSSNSNSTSTTPSPELVLTNLDGLTVSLFIYSASVFSDSINFQKEIALDTQGHPTWHLVKADPINIVEKFKIKRIEPKPSEDDLSALDQLINSAISAITPANVRNQIHDLINENFTAVLNQTLKEIVMGNKIKYSFHHPYHG